MPEEPDLCLAKAGVNGCGQTFALLFDFLVWQLDGFRHIVNADRKARKARRSREHGGPEEIEAFEEPSVELGRQVRRGIQLQELR